MTQPSAILAVDTNPRNLQLLDELLTRHGYIVQRAMSLEQLDQALLAPGPIPLALVDVGGFGSSVWDRCRALRQRGVPVLVVASRPSPEVQRESQASGAQALLVKPLIPRDLLGNIKSLLGQFS